MPFYPSHETLRRQNEAYQRALLKRIGLIPVVLAALFFLHEVLQRVI